MKDSKNAYQQRPEDFMDEDDIREAEESKKLSTNEAFSGFGSTADDVKRRGGFFDLFKPTGETKGVQLLRRMGWREGQGIGPKVRRKAKTDAGEADDGEEHILAPENPPLTAIVHKTDSKGLGYGGEAKLESWIGQNYARLEAKQDEASSDEEEGLGPAFTAPKFRKRPKDAKQSKRKGGFGVGILNGTGSDDEDPYEMGPKISYNRTIGGDKPKKKKEDLGGSNPLLKTKPTFVSKKVAASKAPSGFRKCHDGRYPPEGFTLSSQLDAFSSMAISDDSLRPPEVPKEWKSSKMPQERDNVSGGYVSTADAARNSTLDAKARATLLGEAQLPGKSVFDFLSPAARDRIVQASGKTNLPEGRGEAPPPGFETSEDDKQRALEASVPSLDEEVAIQALQRGIGGWMPYAEDESKRARYRTFLEIKAGLQHGLPEKPPEMPKDNWITEMYEFARAAQVFKPVSGMMASRFTSSSQPHGSSSDPSTVPAAESLLSKPTSSKPEDPADQAAKLGMFGPMTRTITNFYPTRLLCKRFNVKPPANVSFDPGDDHNGDSGNQQKATQLASGSRFQSAGFQTPSTDMASKEQIQHMLSSTTLATEQGGSASNIPGPQPVAGSGITVVDAERNEALEAERPGEAVFKAIFGSDDEDEE